MKKLLLIITALAVVFAGPAHADPISAAVAWAGSTFAVTAATATFIVNFAVSTALTAISSALYKPKQPGADVSFDVKMGDNLPLSFVAGRFATAGKRKYIGSWGDNTRFITEVVEYSALPQGLEGIWINDERGNILLDQGEETLGGIANVGYRLTNFNRDGATRIWVRWLDGTQLAADQTLINLFGNDPSYPWTAQHIGRGKSYAIITSLFDDEILTSYPTFLLEPSPLPLYDWRFDSTNGGSGAQRWGVRSTYQPTRNPAVIGYNIVRGIYYGDEWVYGGKNLPAWRLPIAEWTAAANACDQPVTVAGGGTEPRYRCGFEIGVDMEPASVLDEISKSANMSFVETGGRLKVIVDLPGSSVFSFTDGDILITEGQSFNPFYPASDTFNAVSATYPEPGEKWASKDAPEYVDADAREEDDGRHLPTSMTYGAVPYGRQVQRLLRSQMRDFRRQRRHQFYLPPDAYGLEPKLDMVTWTSARNGYVNKRFIPEIVDKTPGMNVLVNLREVDPGDYDWSSDFERPIIITPPVNPRPFVQPIRGLTAIGTSIQDAGGAARRPAILVACNGDEVGVTEIQIEARRVGTTVAVIDTLRRFSAPFSWYLQNVLPMTDYEVRARLLSDLTPRSAWSSWLTVTTPDVRLGPNDVRYDEIIDEVREDLGEFFEYIEGTDVVLEGMNGRIREAQDLIQQLSDGVADGAFGELLARQQLRTDLLVETETAKSSFREEMDVIITEQLSASIRTQTMRAEFLTSAAVVREQQIALASQTQALAASIDEVEAVLNGAAADGSSSLLSRITQVERVAGTDNRVWRQNAAPIGAAVRNGDYWLDLDASPRQWYSRNSGAWVAVAASTIPPLLLSTEILSDRIDQVAASIDGAVGGATDALNVRVTQIERVAGSTNQVWRQPFPGPTGAQVANGDYWQNTGNQNWFERVNGAWVAIAASSVPRLIIEQAVTSDAITQVRARTNRGTASGLLRATAVTAPDGIISRIALAAEASDGVNESLAAFFLEARGDGTNQIIATANRFAIATGSGPANARKVPFVVDGDNVYASNLLVRTLSIGPDQVVVPVGGRGPIVQQAGEGVWRNLLTLNVPLNQVGRLAVNWAIKHYYSPGGFGAYGLRVQLNGVNIEDKDTNGLPADFPSGNAFGLGVEGTNVVTLDWQGWGATELGARGSMSILGVMR
ncbi:hypothetical protein F1642_04980 [Paracoccus sp. NBH48]|uniref:phage tail protein n=1 Tax=Paracoccus sp. NBH48 TaxID=2596918 RepID=UPI001891D239|nr:phage tail protein [Paracoccus sp. NBH48]MBF5078518.1 hypothetical protein [Paracoccus sp. NBH48]